MESGLQWLLRNMVNMDCGVEGILLTFKATGFGWIVKKKKKMYNRNTVDTVPVKRLGLERFF